MQDWTGALHCADDRFERTVLYSRIVFLYESPSKTYPFLSVREGRQRDDMVPPPRPVARAIYQTALFLAGERELFARLEYLEQMQWFAPDALRQYQEAQLEQVLSHARSTSPFYKDRISELRPGIGASELLAEIPFLGKTDVQKYSASMRSLSPTGPISRKTTGGSTGQPVTVLKDRRATAYERAAMWLAYGWFGVEIGDRAARFWGTPYTWKRQIKSRVGDFCMNRIRFSAFEFNDANLEAYWSRLAAFQPDYIHGYVSMIEQMARSIPAEQRARPSLNLKSVIATAEVLSDPQRAVIEAAFGAPVQVEYGCGEVGPIAHECPDGSLHLMAPNLWVEVLKEDGTPASQGESGEIVLTDLHNRAMPLIRYRVGDYAVRGDACSCGRSFPVLEKVWGRAYDFIESPDGRRYHGEFFMYVFEDLRSRGVPIGQFQVIQSAPDQLTVKTTTSGGASRSTDVAILEAFRARLPGMRIQVEQVPEIPRAASGKMQVIKRYPDMPDDPRA